jgi:hypothetical protein
MTPEKLYTLSDEMVDVCDDIFDEIAKGGNDNKVKVTFCTDQDYLISSQNARATYFMAINLQNKYPESFEVETVNVNLNPTAVAQYKTTSLTNIRPTDVIVSYSGRYRIISQDNFWGLGTSGNSYYNGEYKMVSMIKSVSAVARPAAYFVTNYGTTYYNPEDPTSEASKSLSAFAGLSTFVTILVGVVFNGETLHYYHYIGLLLILTRMVGVSSIAIMKDKKKRLAAAQLDTRENLADEKTE